MITGKPLLSKEQIQSKVLELADKISRDYLGKELLAVGILKGSFMFFADLVRAIRVPITVDFVIASSYLKTTSTGEIKVFYDIREEISNTHVLLIDDIVDTGVSLNFIRENVLSKGPASLRICAFLDKKERRVADVPIDYVGYEIPDKFVVGYGLDYDNKYRNLPYISTFKKET